MRSSILLLTVLLMMASGCKPSPSSEQAQHEAVPNANEPPIVFANNKPFPPAYPEQPVNTYIPALGAKVEEVSEIMGYLGSPVWLRSNTIHLGPNARPLAPFIPSDIADANAFLNELTMATPAEEMIFSTPAAMLTVTTASGIVHMTFISVDFFTTELGTFKTKENALLLLAMGTAPYHPLTNIWLPAWDEIPMVTPDVFFPYIVGEEFYGSRVMETAFKYCLRGGGKGEHEYSRKLSSLLLETLLSRKKPGASFHDLSKYVNMIGDLRGREQLLALVPIALEEQDCCFAPAVAYGLAKCGVLEDAKTLIEWDGGQQGKIPKLIDELLISREFWSRESWQKYLSTNVPIGCTLAQAEKYMLPFSMKSSSVPMEESTGYKKFYQLSETLLVRVSFDANDTVIYEPFVDGMYSWRDGNEVDKK